jgi:hypothetical protein
MTPEVNPSTSTGTVLVVKEPSPNCPSEFKPQHFNPPTDVIAHVWFSPADTARTPLDIPATSIGEN